MVGGQSFDGWRAILRRNRGKKWLKNTGGIGEGWVDLNMGEKCGVDRERGRKVKKVHFRLELGRVNMV